MIKTSILYISAVTLVILAACESQRDIEATLQEINAQIEDVRADYAPDKRVAVFSAEARQEAGQIILAGETTMPDAKAELIQKLESHSISFTDSLLILPDAENLPQRNALVSNSVANIRSAPRHSAELATQATLGTPLKVLKKENSWYLVQTPDKYIAWVDDGAIALMDNDGLNQWMAADKIIYLHPSGFSYEAEDIQTQPVSDLVSGSVLQLLEEDEAFYHVEYPDGRSAYVSKTEALSYDEWLSETEANEETLVNTSKTLMGLPYLWGGTSFKGVDCSGFTKTVYFLNGMIIPRDASQQVHSGQDIDTSTGWAAMQPGDLLFFGTAAEEGNAEKVVHVGMWIGNNEFIHSAGRVKINSVDENASNFDAYNTNRFLRAKRLLNTTTGGDILDLKQVKLYN